ncbi:hypothetical protein ACQP6U_17885 [Acinetobacter baumannii]|uniref:hypothetical protein n=1 Tax=Acinetobacter baumannii TaxID=470 RepID=UPI002446E196|nr:hypothetical protein [Acinetobacter baumannii]MDH2493369.1 hypothetical protein [Acinetobacter baumannii]
MNKLYLGILVAIVSSTTFANDKSLINKVKQEITYQMKDPTSVLFRNVRTVTNTVGRKTVCGEVNGKNSYGGYVGFKDFYNSSIVTDSDDRQFFNLAGCSGKEVELTAREHNLAENRCYLNIAFIKSIYIDGLDSDTAYSKLEVSSPTKEELMRELSKFSQDESHVRSLKYAPQVYSNTYINQCVRNNNIK